MDRVRATLHFRSRRPACFSSQAAVEAVAADLGRRWWMGPVLQRAWTFGHRVRAARKVDWERAEGRLEGEGHRYMDQPSLPGDSRNVIKGRTE